MIFYESKKEDLYPAFIDALIKDTEVLAQIEKIKAHEFVRVIEG